MQTPLQALMKCNFLLKDVANVSQSAVVLTVAEVRRRRINLRNVEQNYLNHFILTAVKNML